MNWRLIFSAAFRDNNKENISPTLVDKYWGESWKRRMEQETNEGLWELRHFIPLPREIDVNKPIPGPHPYHDFLAYKENLSTESESE